MIFATILFYSDSFEREYVVVCQCREEGACALENASESREVEPISSDLRSEATEEEGIAIASKDEEGIEQCVRAMLTVLTL